MSEQHTHAHPDHSPIADAGDGMPGYYEIMEAAVRELLVDKRLISADEIRRMLEVMDSRTPALGESLGAEIDGKLTYYERWIVAFANILFQKQILTPEELARKMEEVEIRWRDDRG